jgi:outer membrane protein OmpA-like peptidoglycan-associated protein
MEIRYGRVGSQFLTFALAPDEKPLGFLAAGDVKLRPQAEYWQTVLVAFNSSVGRFVLEGPGAYEFQIRYNDWDRDSGTAIALESNIVRVDVTDGEGPATADYSGDLARLAQFVPGAFPDVPNLIERGASFVDLHPDSVYSKPLEQALVRALQGGQLTQSHKEILSNMTDRLARQRPGPSGFIRDPWRPVPSIYTLYFAPRETRLTAASREALRLAFAELQADGGRTRIRINGHADGVADTPSVEGSLDLSERRARVVEDALAELGVPRMALRHESWGAEMPVCRESGPSCHERNRRVEVLITEH